MMDNMMLIIAMVTVIFIALMGIAYASGWQHTQLYKAHLKYMAAKQENFNLLRIRHRKVKAMNRFLYTVMMDLILSKDSTDIEYKLANLRILLTASTMRFTEDSEILKLYYDGTKSTSEDAQERLYTALMQLFSSEDSLSFMGDGVRSMYGSLAQEGTKCGEEYAEQVLRQQRAWFETTKAYETFGITIPKPTKVMEENMEYTAESVDGVTVIKSTRLAEEAMVKQVERVDELVAKGIINTGETKVEIVNTSPKPVAVSEMA